MKSLPLFVELCAGLASVSGVLEHGSTWKPPVSRMGRKTGYAVAILRVMGLRPRQKAERYLWAEADGDVAALLAAYTQPEVMREIAEIIRSWIPCPYGPHEVDPSCSRCKGTGRWDARDLWEVLRREKRRGLWEGFEANEIAQACWITMRSYGASGDGFTPGIEDDPKGKASMVEIADRFERAALPWPPVLIAQDAAVDVGSVAGWLGWLALGSPFNPDTYCGLAERAARGAVRNGDAIGWTHERCSAMAKVWPPVTLTPDAAIAPAHIPPGTVVYMDPPYANTTGYKASFSRDQVCETAERWAAAGACVYISEAEPIAIPGWHHVEISSERKGQARTFGATREWLTCSHPPAWTPHVQGSLFR